MRGELTRDIGKDQWIYRYGGALRCNRCRRHMAGTTAYDGACACGGLIENGPTFEYRFKPGTPAAGVLAVAKALETHRLFGGKLNYEYLSRSKQLKALGWEIGTRGGYSSSVSSVYGSAALRRAYTEGEDEPEQPRQRQSGRQLWGVFESESVPGEFYVKNFYNYLSYRDTFDKALRVAWTKAEVRRMVLDTARANGGEVVDV